MWVWAVTCSVPPILDSDIVWRQRPPLPSSSVALEMRSQLEGRLWIPGAQAWDDHPSGTQQDPRVLASSDKHNMGVGGEASVFEMESGLRVHL